MLTSARPIDWLVFAGSVVAAVLLARLLFGRSEDKISFREAALRSLLWVALGLSFALYVYAALGREPSVDYLVAYFVEKSLSFDNLFVFLVVFGYFKVDDRQQQRVLAWGILGAMVMRAVFVLTGTALLQHFHWAMYLFGGFLVYSAVHLLLRRSETVDPSKGWTMRLARRYLHTTGQLHGTHFFVREGPRIRATPLVLVLVVIESTDLMFAVDSVPAVLAISRDLFVVYTSNILAILGLRALYFVLAGMMRKFRYLEIGLSAILGFIGFKMLITDFYELSNLVSLAVVGALLVLAVLASVYSNRRLRDGRQT